MIIVVSEAAVFGGGVLGVMVSQDSTVKEPVTLDARQSNGLINLSRREAVELIQYISSRLGLVEIPKPEITVTRKQEEPVPVSERAPLPAVSLEARSAVMTSGKLIEPLTRQDIAKRELTAAQGAIVDRSSEAEMSGRVVVYDRTK